MDGTKRADIQIGATVMVVQKQDQRSGKLTEGKVKKILTNSAVHHRGIKVMLENGVVGRVHQIDENKKG
ncbi:YwbE family protein [Terrilactibacillus laevilacticus]|uniref:YwbE family protein n=1 Tax=Terrilactibacillus laevilacticus TaxID=1380157 RepID=A0ABW5PVC6_9BACI|nr:YwbE family protein [Terrilactibacillus laevilacticus]